jgi:hypothetical protein
MTSDPGIEDPAVQAWSIDLPDAGSTRGTAINEARWSEDGSRLFVSRTVDPRAWPLLDAAQPDIGALIIIFGVLAILIGIARIFRHPRTAGRSYCRRCNHDLNAVHGERPSALRCPECGLPLDGRGVVRGFGRGLRLARVGIPALVTVACGVTIFLTSIAPRQTPRLKQAWPAAAASAVPNWPWWRRSTIDFPYQFNLRVDVIRVDVDGLRLESAALLPGVSPPWVARPDGTTIAWTEHSEDAGWVPRVAWFDTVRGRSESADLDPAQGIPAICGWSPDGREIVALLQDTGSGYRTRDDGSAIMDADVMAIDTTTGTVRTVGRGRGRATGGPPAGWMMGPAIAALGTDPHTRAVTLAAEQEKPSSRSTRGGLALRELTVIGDSGVRVIPLAGELVEGNWGMRRAWITTDGRLGVEFLFYPNVNSEMQSGPERFIDLTSGAVSDPPSSNIAAKPGTSSTGKPSPDGSRHVRIEVDCSAPDTVARIGVVVTPAPPPHPSLRTSPATR